MTKIDHRCSDNNAKVPWPAPPCISPELLTHIQTLPCIPFSSRLLWRQFSAEIRASLSEGHLKPLHFVQTLKTHIQAFWSSSVPSLRSRKEVQKPSQIVALLNYFIVLFGCIWSKMSIRIRHTVWQMCTILL